MKILVTGADGQLGREIFGQGIAKHEMILTDVATLDITDGAAVMALFRDAKPDAVVHCAAHTQVDGAQANPEQAFRVNAVGAQNVASACLETSARMVYVSTDYVFDGTGQSAYREFDKTNPQTVYGMTKWQGEEMVRHILGRHYIVRTAWLYGDGNNFVRTMLALAGERDTLSVVEDQIGTPTSTAELAATIYRLLEQEAGYGVYHATCQGQCSWYEFACEIFRQAGRKVRVVPVTTEQFPSPARRPAYSVLDNYMLRLTIGDVMSDWRQALAAYMMK